MCSTAREYYKYYNTRRFASAFSRRPVRENHIKIADWISTYPDTEVHT